MAWNLLLKRVAHGSTAASENPDSARYEPELSIRFLACDLYESFDNNKWLRVSIAVAPLQSMDTPLDPCGQIICRTDGFPENGVLCADATVFGLSGMVYLARAQHVIIRALVYAFTRSISLTIRSHSIHIEHR